MAGKGSNFCPFVTCGLYWAKIVFEFNKYILGLCTISPTFQVNIDLYRHMLGDPVDNFHVHIFMISTAWF